MKKQLLCCLFLALLILTSIQIFAQVGINTDGSDPDSSAMLDVKSTTHGILIPRVSVTQRDLIPSPATGLLIYNTSTNLFNYFNGNYWLQVETAFISSTIGTISEGRGVSINASPDVSPDNSAMLDVNNPSRGILIPRTTPDQINSPAIGLIIYNITTNLLNYYNGDNWITLCALTTGVAGAGGSQSSIGLAIKTDNSDPDQSALLDVSAADKGVLIPRLSNEQRDDILPATGLVIYNSSSNNIEFYNGSGWYHLVTNLVLTPEAWIHVPAANQIIWNWTPVSEVTGYKWNTVNDYASATDLGTSTTFTETGLTCNTNYTRFIWAYNDCGYSVPLTLTQATWNCETCGTIIVNHIAGTVSPVNKNVTYGTVLNLPGEPMKCWITSNLGSDNQATSVADTTEPSAGWYWQFNRKQGYKHDGTTRTPNTTWITSIIENLEWQPANDPCTIELGNNWRIPTYAEWLNVYNSCGWTNRNGPWNSGLKLHAAGYLWISDGTLTYRGSDGYYWSTAQFNVAAGWGLFFNNEASYLYNQFGKGLGFTQRCIKYYCIPPDILTPSTNVPSSIMIIWKWNTHKGATGYKWNTVNDFNTAIDLGTANTKTEVSLTCNTAYTRYVWAYNDCGHSTVLILNQSTLACLPCESTITDGRDGKTYNTVLIGDQCWMKENLNIGTRINSTQDQSNNGIIEKYCYGNVESNCDVYGGMYMWNELMDYTASSNSNPSERKGICPTGWHLPSDAEWCQIETYLDPAVDCNSTGWQNTDAGGKMKEAGTLHWAPPNTGATNSSGFTALPGGIVVNNGGIFHYLTAIVDFWSTTESSSDAWTRGMHNELSTLNRNLDPKTMGLGARCLRDTCTVVPGRPTSGTHSSTYTQIIWNWNTVPGAIGYKWNTVDDYNTATDMGTSTTKTETGLTCSNYYYRYVWSYNTCGYSTFRILVMSTITCWTCGNPLYIDHVEGTVAPVTKTVAYGTAYGIPGEPSKCWITRNLGATQQAGNVGDPAEASAGWYWQFNRMQGYKHDGTTRTPNTTWITFIDENAEWQATNDPCATELGNGWHVPTALEWYNADLNGGWINLWSVYYSSLKLHLAGGISFVSGALLNRGYTGYYWSNNQYNTNTGYILNFSSDCDLKSGYNKANAFPIRCLKDPQTQNPPTVSTNVFTNKTSSSVTTGGSVSSDGGASVTARGVCWGTSSVPAIADSHTSDGSGAGTFSSNISDLEPNTLYYFRAYATNSIGTSYGNELTFTTLGPTSNCGSFTINHVAGSVAPVSKTVTYYTVTNIPGEISKCWITSNLGADHEAATVDDGTEASAGWYWQFNRRQGYKNDGTTPTPAWTITSIDENSDWESVNDPCNIELGDTWRVPTYTEWLNVDATGDWSNWNGPWNSGLKLHAAGYLSSYDGSLWARDDNKNGYYWSSVSGGNTNGYHLAFSKSGSYMNYNSKAFGFSLRCLKYFNQSPYQPSNPGPGTGAFNQSINTTLSWSCSDPENNPLTFDVFLGTTNPPSQVSTGQSGYTYNPGTLQINTIYFWKIVAHDDHGNMTEGPVWMFSTYPQFTCGIPVPVTHVAGDIAPVNKSINYNTVLSDLTGYNKCWITQNLGAGQQATAVDDNTEASAGWYWQFNRKQGYKHNGTKRTPNSTWITTINEDSDWLPENDPCRAELGIAWRIPTLGEWYNTNLNGGWNNWFGPWNSDLKIHASGFLYGNDGSLGGRGSNGNFWGSMQFHNNENAVLLNFSIDYSGTFYNIKSCGFSLRCLRFPCSVSPDAPASGSHIPGKTQIIWRWNDVNGSTGYKWNTTNDYETATDLGTDTSKVETGLTCNTAYSRFVWAYNECGHSFVLQMNQTTAACNSCGSPITDSRDGKTYNTVFIGDQCWMKENLNIGTRINSTQDQTNNGIIEKYCYGNIESNCDVYGGMYMWNELMNYTTSSNDNPSGRTGICPAGWHLPSDAEWCQLETYLDPAVDCNSTGWQNTDAGGKMKEAGTVHWAPPNTGATNSSGFTSLPGGIVINNGGIFQYLTTLVDFWSSTEYGSDAWTRGMHNELPTLNRNHGVKTGGLGARCLRDTCSFIPNTPSSAGNTSDYTQITWRWNAVNGAKGYKWNNVNIYETATDLGTTTTKTEYGLTCNTSYIRYVWAYTDCENSPSLVMNKSTLVCPCGPSFTINHFASGNFAPVNKMVTYGTVTNIPGEPTKCWITSNLGADHQASAVDDGTEASAGWYWQFNRKQGYKHDGTTRTPNTIWISSIDVNTDWQNENDPCTHEVGGLWRIPTKTEWTDVNSAGGWTNWNGPWNSALKLHAAGYLNGNDGVMTSRGLFGPYWSNTQYDGTRAWHLAFTGSNSYMDYTDLKTGGYPLRCIRLQCYVPPDAPSSGNLVPSTIQIIWNWNLVPDATGYKWNTVNDYNTATDLDTTNTKTEVSLTCNTAYTRYVWAYNDCGYSSVLVLNQSTLPCLPCEPTISDSRDGKTYNTVLIGDQCWMKENLNIGTRINSTQDQTNNGIIEKYCYGNVESNCDVYGGMYMWNELMNYTASSNSNPSERKGICPTGWHIPSDAEWCQIETFLDPAVDCNSTGWQNTDAGGKMKEAGTLHWAPPNTGATNSSGFTALPGGIVVNNGGIFHYLTTLVDFWSTTESTSDAWTRGMHNELATLNRNLGPKTTGLGARCLRDTCTLVPGAPTSEAHNSNYTQIIWNWNTVNRATGYKWNTINDYCTATDMGTFTTKTETGLNCGNSYTRYVWAYNNCGQSLPVALTQATWDCGTCGTITINHAAGVVAPVTKTVNYGTVINVPGEPSKCWITSNLGADHQATALTDATEASAGWYWQFNRKQGYKHDGTTRTPNTTWISSISENLEWQPANDPCSIEMGTPLRIPTYAEWFNVDNVGGWTNWNGPWNSVLKLHVAGYLWVTDGNLTYRGSDGYYWSSAQFNVAAGWGFVFYSSDSYMYNQFGKPLGFPLRCIKEN